MQRLYIYPLTVYYGAACVKRIGTSILLVNPNTSVTVIVINVLTVPDIFEGLSPT